MAQVTIEINDRSYTMQCADGEEGHLQALARILDEEVARIRDAVGAVGDVRLLLMAGLMVADRAADCERRIEALKDQIEGLRASRAEALEQGRELEDSLADRLDQASDRIESLARKLIERR